MHAAHIAAKTMPKGRPFHSAPSPRRDARQAHLAESARHAETRRPFSWIQWESAAYNGRLVSMKVMDMDMINIGGEHGYTGLTDARAWHTESFPEVRGHVTNSRSATTGVMRVTQRGFLTVAHYGNVVHLMQLGIGNMLMLDMDCTRRTRVVAPLTKSVVSEGLKRGCCLGRGSPPPLRLALTMLDNTIHVAARAEAVWMPCNAHLVTATMTHSFGDTAAVGTATPRTCPGTGLLRGCTSPARESWDTEFALTMTVMMRELLAATADPHRRQTMLHQFVGGTHRLGATAGKPVAAAGPPLGTASKFVGTTPSLGGARQLTRTRRARTSAGAGRWSNGGRRLSRTRHRAAALPGTLPASPKTPPGEWQLGPAARAQHRP